MNPEGAMEYILNTPVEVLRKEFPMISNVNIDDGKFIAYLRRIVLVAIEEDYEP